MKKILFMLAMVLPVLVFTACSDDDDKINSPVVGMWVHERIIGDNVMGTMLELKDDGTCHSWDLFNSEVYEDTGNYSVTNTTITISWKEAEETVVMHYEIKGEWMFTTMEGEEGSTEWKRTDWSPNK